MEEEKGMTAEWEEEKGMTAEWEEERRPSAEKIAEKDCRGRRGRSRGAGPAIER